MVILAPTVSDKERDSDRFLVTVLDVVTVSDKARDSDRFLP